MRPKVALVKCADYEQDLVDKSLHEVFNLLGGLEKIVKPEKKVLIKINLLSADEPEKYITTHPSLVKSIVDEVRRCGGIPIVGDSPSNPLRARNKERFFSRTGIKEICEKDKTEYLFFDDDAVEKENPDGKLYKKFTIGRALKEADVIINVPKLKTHAFMVYTGAVKNMFGCIPGLKKSEFHLKVSDANKFADMLIDLLLCVKPHLHIMDAVVGMDGNGPSNGNPKKMDTILASENALALDVVAAKMIGIKPKNIYTNKMGLERGLLNGEVDNIEILGESLDDVLVKDFKPPSYGVLSGLMPTFLYPRLKKYVSARPMVDKEKCTGCRNCEEVCASGAIKVVDKKARVDNNICIRCYCCQEVCPEDAVYPEHYWFVKPFVPW